MKRQLSNREIRLLMLVPALVILTVYAVVYERPLCLQINTLNSAIGKIQENPVAPSQLDRANVEIVILTSQIDLEKRHLAASTQPSLALPTWWPTSDGRVSALAGIDAAFDSHAVQVLTTSHLPAGSISGIAPRSLQDFAAAVTREGHSQLPQVWRIDVIGSYADVLAALSDIGHRDAFVMPLGISMESINPETTYRKWSLWIWA
jgi:hypothetical protein